MLRKDPQEVGGEKLNSEVPSILPGEGPVSLRKCYVEAWSSESGSPTVKWLHFWMSKGDWGQQCPARPSPAYISSFSPTTLPSYLQQTSFPQFLQRCKLLLPSIPSLISPFTWRLLLQMIIWPTPTFPSNLCLNVAFSERPSLISQSKSDSLVNHCYSSLCFPKRYLSGFDVTQIVMWPLDWLSLTR